VNQRTTKKSIFELPNFHKFFEVKCDASGMVIGFVLSEKEIPISYFSEKINDSNQKNSSYDKNLCYYIGIEEVEELFDSKIICFVHR